MNSRMQPVRLAVTTGCSLAFVLLSSMAAWGQAKPSAAQEEKEEQPLVAVYSQAVKHFDAGEYEQAAAHAKELCLRKPDEFRFHFLRGEVCFASGDMVDSIAAFDEVTRLQPRMEPQLWQRGLALYYADRFEDGVKQFETHQTVNSQDVENAVWHMLCAARETSVEDARKNIINVRLDRRVPMAQVLELFDGKMSVEDVLEAANATSPSTPVGSERHDLQLYYAHLYIGLYQEMMGEHDAAKESMKRAIKVNPLKKNNFMGRVAPVHAQVRGWIGKAKLNEKVIGETKDGQSENGKSKEGSSGDKKSDG